METTFDKFLKEYQEQMQSNPDLDSIRFHTWLQTKLLMEINEKLDKLLMDKGKQ